MHFFRTVLVLSLFGISIAQADDQVTPMRVPIDFKRLYIPEGFDDNDHIQIVGSGIYPNTCYRNAETFVNIDERKKRINLNPVAYYYSGICLQVLLPFEQVADIGLLKQGTYSIFQNNGEEKIGTLTVGPAKTIQPDDDLYAPVSQVFVKTTANVTNVYVTGELPNSCMKFRSLDVKVRSSVIELRPLVDLVRRSDCQDGKFKFEVSRPINLPTGRYLVHARSMNGRAVNSVIEIE